MSRNCAIHCHRLVGFRTGGIFVMFLVGLCLDILGTCGWWYAHQYYIGFKAYRCLEIVFKYLSIVIFYEVVSSVYYMRPCRNFSMDHLNCHGIITGICMAHLSVK